MKSVNPDAEILKALRPSLATTGGLLCAISSPHAKRGALYSTFRRHYGPDGHPLILVAKAPTRTMNPSLPQRVVDRAYEEDPESASAEFGAEFRSDLEAFVSREIVEGCVIPGVIERPPMSSISYQAFVDPSGGSADSMTLCIGHSEGLIVVIDAIRERRPPFSPESVVIEFSDLLKAYRVSKVIGDRYAGEWPRERFRERGITYEPAAKPKSDLYLALLATLNSGRVELPDDKRLVGQLCSLERRTARGGRDTIDHAPGAHDDLANSIAGLSYLFATGASTYDSTFLSWVSDDAEPTTETITRMDELPLLTKRMFGHPFFTGRGY